MRSTPEQWHYSRKAKPMAIVIAVCNEKGGVGKTTTARNLAGGLSQRGYTVLAVDLDGQCNLTNAYNVPISADNNILTALEGKGSVAEAVVHTPEGDLITGTPLMKTAEARFLKLMAREKLLTKALKPLQKEYNFIILDTPPQFSIVLLNALCCSNLVVIPTLAEKSCLEGTASVIETVDTVNETFDTGVKIAGILMTMHNERSILKREMQDLAESLAKEKGTKVFNAYIRQNTAIGEAYALGESIYTYDKKSNGCSDYTAFVEELLQDIGKE